MLSLTTELDAVNTMLSAIGEAPVSTLDDTGLVDATMASQILAMVNREVQSKGWHFNTERAMVLKPTFPNNYLVLPANTLRVDSVLEDADKNVVQRGQKLYDKKNHTFAFEKPLKVDLVVLLQFDELPEYARQYITIRAARIFQERTIGSQELSMFSERDEMMAKVDLMDADAENADYNVLTGSLSVARILER